MLLRREVPLPESTAAAEITVLELATALESGEPIQVVDPPLDSSTILANLASRGARIVGVADTHVHADYLSGAPRLSRELGVPY